MIELGRKIEHESQRSCERSHLRGKQDCECNSCHKIYPRVIGTFKPDNAGCTRAYDTCPKKLSGFTRLLAQIIQRWQRTQKDEAKLNPESNIESGILLRDIEQVLTYDLLRRLEVKGKLLCRLSDVIFVCIAVALRLCY